jgi:hypothetical protein
MKRQHVLLAAMTALLLLTLSACDSKPKIEVTPFDADNSALLVAERADRESPIILEGDEEKNLGGWRCEESPSAYWGVVIPEDGNYRVTVTYSRGEEGSVRGWAGLDRWDGSAKEWRGYVGAAVTYQNTGDWSVYEEASRVAIADFTTTKGEVFRFSIRPDPFEHENNEYFINLRSVRLEKVSEEEAESVETAETTDDGSEADGSADDGSENDDSEADGSADDGSKDDVGRVAMFDGTWWHREVPVDGMSLDVFSFDGDTAVFFDQNGNEIARGAATDRGDGTFTLELELFGEVEFRIGQTEGSWTIATTEDGALFLPGEPIDRSAAAEGYTGKWYQNGDLNADYLSVEEDGTYGLYSKIGDEILAREQGKWTLLDRSIGKSLEVDGSFSRSSFSITSDGTAMWDRDDNYYIKESLIGGAEGDLARQTVSLFAARYWAPEIKETGSIYLEFREDGSLKVMTRQEDGAIDERGIGSWARQGEGAFSLTLDDGEEHSFTVKDHVLTLDDGRTFNRFSFFG